MLQTRPCLLSTRGHCFVVEILEVVGFRLLVQRDGSHTSHLLMASIELRNQAQKHPATSHFLNSFANA